MKVSWMIGVTNSGNILVDIIVFNLMIWNHLLGTLINVKFSPQEFRTE